MDTIRETQIAGTTEDETKPETDVIQDDLSSSKAAEDEVEELAGVTLMKLVGISSAKSQNVLFEDEKKALEGCFDRGRTAREFAKYHIDAIRSGVLSKNDDLVRFLLDKDTSKQLLKDDIDIVLITIRENADHWGPSNRRRSEDILEIIQLLISHGATTNTLDDQGNSPLYYTCLYGLPNLFRVLINSDADYTTQHDRFAIESARTSRRIISIPGSSKVNLLQATADALHTSPHIKNSISNAYSIWSPMIMFLVEAGLTIPLNDPATATALDAACFEGNLDHVEKLLDHGVYSGAGVGAAGSHNLSLTPGLHSATQRGHAEIVTRLLSYGASASTKHLYKTYRSQSLETAIARVCGADYRGLPQRLEPGVLDACEVLFDAGVDDEDQRILLEESARQGRISLLRRLLALGVRAHKVPLTGSLVSVQILFEHGANVDPVEFQKHAIRIGSLEMMRWIVQRAGPCLREKKDFGAVLGDVFRQPNTTMLTYLTTQYGRATPKFHGIHSEISSYLFEAAGSGWGGFLVLQKLLQEGSDHKCPGIHETALSVLKSRLLQGTDQKRVSGDHIRRFQLLLLYGNREANLQHRDHNKLWLKPASLPSDLYKSFRESKKSWGPDGFGWRKRDQSVKKHLPLAGTKHYATLGYESRGFGNDKGVGGQDRKLQKGVELQLAANFQTTLVPYKYNKLIGPYDVRLLVVEPSATIQARIVCRLIHTTLTETPEYETLSYVWGDPEENVEILLQGVRFSIRKNLYRALRRLRLSNQSRTLWVDAICIDQKNVNERSQQVAIMRHIYQSATKVMVWVGEEADDSRLIFQHVKKWTTYCEDYRTGRTKRNDAFGEAHINPPTYSGRTYDAFKKFCLRPWFFRTWTIQELALSRQAIFMCGPYQEEWSLLVKPMSFSEIAYDPLQGVHGPTHLHHLDQIKENPPHFERVLKYSSLCKATDARDKVYGLLGLFDRPLIQVDYNLGVEVVYRRFAQIILEDSGKIHLLHCLGTQKHIETLPSWVPDFSISSPIGLLPRVTHFSFTVNEVSELLRSVLSPLRFEGRTMAIRGHYIENILAVSDELVARSANGPGSQHFAEVLQKWESLATQIQHTRLSQPIAAAFLYTLLAQDNQPHKSSEESGYLLPYYAAWYSLFGSGMLKAHDTDYFQQLDVILEWWGGKYQEKSMGHDIDHFTHAMKECCYGRSFFVTDKGSMGLAPPRARPGDEIVYFPGGLYPFVLRDCGDGMYSMVGDCYLYGFDEFAFTREEVEKFEEFVLQ
ncbi:hypothetical protein MMC10_004996 [Thelotrema lepadinum]|nr:hypothetical protein [Thelotrema lepadinum]